MDPVTKRIALPDEEPEIFSSVLEFLYKGDYFPRLVHSKRRNSYELESAGDDERSVESTVYHRGVEGDLLKDTVIYCAAERYGLDELKKISLRKQGLRKFTRSVHDILSQTNDDNFRVWHSVQHHPRFRSLRLRQYARQRLQASSSLPRSHHPLTLDFQA